MAKILKVKVTRSVVGEREDYTYPPEYDATKISVIANEFVGDRDTMLGRGGSDAYVLGVVRDSDAAKFLESKDIVEVNDATAITLGDKWRPMPAEVVTDQPTAILVLAKKARGEVLTRADQDAIDPTKPNKGINAGASFSDMLALAKSLTIG